MFSLAFHIHIHIFPTAGYVFPKYLQCCGPEPYWDVLVMLQCGPVWVPGGWCQLDRPRLLIPLSLFHVRLLVHWRARRRHLAAVRS